MTGFQAQHLTEVGSSDRSGRTAPRVSVAAPNPGSEVGGVTEPATVGSRTPARSGPAGAADLSAESRAIAANAGDDAARSLREAMEAAEAAGARRSRDFYRGALLMTIRANSELIVPVEEGA